MVGASWLIASIVLLLAPNPISLKQADSLAARARSTKGDGKTAAVAKALDAYAQLLRRFEKDRRLVPRIRRRRASLLKSTGDLVRALEEYDLILEGRADRMDRARALLDGAKVLQAQGKLAAAEVRLREVIRRYRDATRTRAVAALRRGQILEKLERDVEAIRSYRVVVEECRFEEKIAIEAYDALALHAIARGRARDARRWLHVCEKRYGKRAARGDKKGAFLGRQLAAMKAPAALAKLELQKLKPGAG